MSPSEVITKLPPRASSEPKPTFPVALKSIAPETLIDPLPSMSPSVASSVRSPPIVPLLKVTELPVTLVSPPLIALAMVGVPAASITMSVAASSVPKLASPPVALAVIPLALVISPTAIVSAVKSTRPPLVMLPIPGVFAPIAPLDACSVIALGEVSASNSISPPLVSRIAFASSEPIAIFALALRSAVPATVMVPPPVMSPVVERTVRFPPIVPLSSVTLSPVIVVLKLEFAVPTLASPALAVTVTA